MMYSFRIEQAIRAATVLHKNQMRKGRAPYPYVAHSFSVACISADYTQDEDVIIASLLHDTLESTDYTADELENDFGKHVRTMVESISESKEQDSSAWLLQKEIYLEKIARAEDDALLVLAAESIHNMRSIIEEYQATTRDYLADFHGTLEDRLVFYQKMSNLFNRTLKNGIVHEFNHVFDEYKKFLTYGS